MIESYKLAHHDGTLCVVAAIADYNEPLVVSHYWPVCEMTTREYSEAGYDTWTVSSNRGEFYATPPGWKHGKIVNLRDGGRTKSIHTTTAPIDPPKVRKGTAIEYRDGHYHTRTSKGSWKRV